jgi:hypothetical protein
MEIFINELSSDVYEVVASDATGPRFRTTGADPATLIETARAWVRENTAGYFPASHYLWIYRRRLDRAEGGGITHGSQAGVEFMRELVGNLVKLDPSTPVGLEIVCGLARFTNATTGALLGEIFVGTDHGRDG